MNPFVVAAAVRQACPVPGAQVPIGDPDPDDGDNDDEDDEDDDEDEDDDGGGNERSGPGSASGNSRNVALTGRSHAEREAKTLLDVPADAPPSSTVR
ncbi:MAG TPA: hypothetical protein VNE58_08810 [Casimicrobiaceae bacterium]|nr:hypothetical protein [Casimicrobiaceae bacterium]